MPKKYLMCWQRDRCRWRKMFKGKWFIVTPKELGCLGTKEDSWAAANKWWESKMTALTISKETIQGLTKALELLTGSKSVADKLFEAEEKGKAAEFINNISKYLSFSTPQSETNQTLVQLINHDHELTDKAIEYASELQINTPKKSSNWGLGNNSSIGFPKKSIEDRETQIKTITSKLSSSSDELDPSIQTQFEKWKQIQIGSDRSPARIKMNIIMAEYFVNYFSQNPLKEIDESSWEDYFCFIKQKDWSNSYKSRVLNSGKMFLNYLYEKKLVDLPRNLMSRVLKFKVSKQKINSTTPEIIQKLFLNANNQLKLHILLMANCGMISQDISDLQDSEVDWTNGTITRKRSKTKDHENVPEVCYKLWSETFELLKKYRSGTETVLLTKSGQPWIKRSITLKEYKNSNSIASNFKALCVKLNIKGVTTKQIRTTSSCTLAKHREFKFYTQYFLGQSPNGTTDSHYVEPSKEEFFEALDWLRTKFIL